MKLHSYVVARDFGFAPNPFFGICTLATCKPKIRSAAQIGDWVTGTGSKPSKREKHVVYVMLVTGTMTFQEYWDDPSFQRKKPNLRGSKKQAFGDNIYSTDAATGQWCQINSHHSLDDGSPNPLNVKADTGTNRILLSDDLFIGAGLVPSCQGGSFAMALAAKASALAEATRTDFRPSLLTITSHGFGLLTRRDTAASR